MVTMNLTTRAAASRGAPRRNGLLLAVFLLPIGLGAGLFLVVTQWLPLESGQRWIADNGAVQAITFATLIASAVLAGVLAVRHPAQRINLVLTALMLIVYAGREADLHKAAWMPEDFTSVRLYSAAGVPLWQKIACGLLMLSIIVAAVSLVARTAPRVLTDLRARRVWMLFAGAWLCVFAASQCSDQSGLNEIFAGQAFEEIAECVAAGFVAPAVYFFPREDRWISSRTTTDRSDGPRH